MGRDGHARDGVQRLLDEAGWQEPAPAQMRDVLHVFRRGGFVQCDVGVDAVVRV